MIKYGEKNDGKYIKDSKRHGIRWKYLTMCNWNWVGKEGGIVQKQYL